MNAKRAEKIFRHAVKVMEQKQTDYPEEIIVEAALEAGISQYAIDQVLVNRDAHVGRNMALIILFFLMVAVIAGTIKNVRDNEANAQAALEAMKTNGTVTLQSAGDTSDYLTFDTTETAPECQFVEENQSIKFYTTNKGKEILALVVDPDGTIHTRGKIKEDLK